MEGCGCPPSLAFQISADKSPNEPRKRFGSHERRLLFALVAALGVRVHLTKTFGEGGPAVESRGMFHQTLLIQSWLCFVRP